MLFLWHYISFLTHSLSSTTSCMNVFDEDMIKIEIVVCKLLMKLVSMQLSFHFDANSYCF